MRLIERQIRVSAATSTISHPTGTARLTGAAARLVGAAARFAGAAGAAALRRVDGHLQLLSLELL